MELNELPKLKDTENKFKKTFLLSEEAVRIYVQAKQKLNVDTTKLCTDAIENSLLSIKHLLDK